ncbi:MAG: hypothetical protein GX344_07050 [Intrasporangiaceae bacterium]|nr:hypothetical protein [Intrasporangiaceae bacterium]
MNDFWNMAWLILAGLLPFLGFLVVCFVVMRAIFNADRNERKAVQEWERSQEQGTAEETSSTTH